MSPKPLKKSFSGGIVLPANEGPLSWNSSSKRLSLITALYGY